MYTERQKVHTDRVCDEYKDNSKWYSTLPYLDCKQLWMLMRGLFIAAVIANSITVIATMGFVMLFLYLTKQGLI